LTDKAANFIADHIVKAEMKTEGGVKYPASDFAYVPDVDKPSTWKLRMSEGQPGNITKAQLGRAAAAFSPGGFRGQKVEIPSGDVAKVKAKIRAEYSKLGVEVDDIPPAIKERELMVYKSGDTYRWAAIYSNNYRDRDNPPEIISKAAHQDFVRAVDAGEWPYPEVAWWHVKNKPLGKADLVFWDNSTNCAWAAGDFVSKEVADAIAGCSIPLAVSHGMPRKEIERDPQDDTVITRYRSAEISFLPARVAANLLTGIYSKETDMNEDQKLEELRQVSGLDPKILGAEKKAEAEEAKLESKEVKEEVPVVEIAPEPETVQPALTPELIGQAMAQAIQPVLDRLTALEQKAQAEPVEEKEADDPFAALMHSFKSSVIGSEEARVDGRTKEAKDAPVEHQSGFPAKRVKVNSESLVANTLNRLYDGTTAKELTEQAGRQH
jgi:hypothetical protein